jgi:type I restriction enzyme S subunit
VRLGDVGAVVGGGTPKSSESRYWAEGQEVPWLTPADMRHQPSRYITRGRRDITGAGLASSGAQLLPPGTVLFSSRAPIGHVGIAAGALSTNQGFKSCVPYVAAMSEYLYLFLRKVGPEVDASASGTTFREVTGKDVSLIPLPLPPLAEQHRIVARVDALMGLLDRLEVARASRERTRAAVRDSALAALREADAPEEVEVAWNRFAERMDDLLIDPSDIAPLRRTVLELAVRGRLVKQEPAEGTAETVLEALCREKESLVKEGLLRRRLDGPEPVDAVPFSVPESWRWAKAVDLCLFIADGDHQPPPQVSDGVPFLVIGNVSGGKVDLTSTRKVPPEYFDALDWTRKPDQGDLLYTVTGSFGIVLEVGATGPFCVQRHIGIIKTAHSFNNRYLAYALRSPTAYRHATRVATGTAQKTVPLSGLRRLPVPVPPLEEQHRIVARVDDLMNVLDRLDERVASARTAHAAFAAAAVHHLSS